MKSGFEKEMSSPLSRHQIPKVESSRWVTGLPQCEHRNRTQIFVVQRDLKMPLTPGWDKRNLVPNTLGLNENHSSQGAWARRKKNKRKENREEGDNMFKVPSLRSWQ